MKLANTVTNDFRCAALVHGREWRCSYRSEPGSDLCGIHGAKRKEERAERDAEIVRRRRAGETLRAIGQDYDLTGERVRRIVLKAEAQT